MSDIKSGPVFRSPVVRNYPKGDPQAPLVLSDYSTMTKMSIRAADGAAAIGQLDVAFGRTRMSGPARICGIRPDEWWVIGDHHDVSAVTDQLDTSGHVSMVDLTHGRCMFRVTGDDAARMLEKVCGLDWSDNMMPDGAATSASVAKTTCDIVRADNNGVRSYLLACDRSFGQYLFDALLDAGDEFSISVGALA